MRPPGMGKAESGSEPIRIYIGYDSQETIAYHVLAHSLMRHASQPISVAPIMLSQLGAIFQRPPNSLASTEFSFSRFLVPYLCNYQGWAIFMDCDMLCRTDISKLWAQRDEDYAVQVVKHEHKPEQTTKFNNHVQTRYAKKNWSSVMLMNCARCTNLTLDFVNNASGLQLHQFKWLRSDRDIGDIEPVWNHLVGYDLYAPDAALVHFTEGGPYFSAYRDCDYADEWFAEHALTNAVRDDSAPRVILDSDGTNVGNMTAESEKRVSIRP